MSDGAKIMYSIGIRGRLCFTSHVLSFREYHDFWNSLRGAYILRALSASWTPISMLLYSCLVVNPSPCFKWVRIHSRKAPTSVECINETLGSYEDF